MLRQLANLRRYGRLRTNAPTRRKGKPAFLKEHPEYEITGMLDLVFAHYGKSGGDFFFIQIGAFDGVTADPLHHLVHQHGWRGVLVEPQIEAFELLKKNYGDCEGLQFHNVAIGPCDGEITLYTRTGGMVQAASVEKHLMNKPGRRRVLDARSVPCWTFSRLLAESDVPETIDLAQIDAEGCDFEIIRSFDFERFKPAIIRYEHMVLSQADRNACLELLAGHGYRFILEDADTTAYLERASLHQSSHDAKAA